MFERLKGLIKRVDERWRGAQLSKVALGKYIVLFASVLHIGWAALLMGRAETVGSTPIAVLSEVFGGRWRSAVVLLIVAGLALVFPFLKRGASNATLALLLLPQQVALFMSAGAGLWAAMKEQYADGVTRGWAFILSDQLPVILLSIMYTVVVIEAAFEPPTKVVVTDREAAEDIMRGGQA